MNQKITKKYILLFLLLIVVIESMILLREFFPVIEKAITKKTPESLIREYSDIVIKKCKSSGFKLGCYDKEIPKLMDLPFNLSMEDAFRVTRYVQRSSPEYTYCHVLGHNLSTKETKKDPDKWKDVITRCPATTCNNGCLHGALMERFKSEHLTDSQIKKIIPDLKTVCEPRGTWKPVGVEIAMCYHALGHLNMYITNGDVRKSTSICEKIGKKPGSDIPHNLRCIQGTLMSIFQPLEAEDFALVKGKQPKKEEVESYCNSFEGYPRYACFKESWPLFRQEIMKPEGATKFCSYTTDPQEIEGCYNHVLHIVTVVFAVDMNDLNKLRDYCLGLPEKAKDFCFGSAADRLLQIDPVYYADRALRVCAKAEEVGLGKKCYEMLIQYGTISFHKGSQGASAFCQKFTKSWGDSCRKKLL